MRLQMIELGAQEIGGIKPLTCFNFLDLDGFDGNDVFMKLADIEHSGNIRVVNMHSGDVYTKISSTTSVIIRPAKLELIKHIQPR